MAACCNTILPPEDDRLGLPWDSPEVRRLFPVRWLALLLAVLSGDVNSDETALVPEIAAANPTVVSAAAAAAAPDTAAATPTAVSAATIPTPSPASAEEEKFSCFKSAAFLAA